MKSKFFDINSKIKNITKETGFVNNIEHLTESNTYFRRVVFTAHNSQLVVMSLNPKEDIGEEIHKVDQFIRIEKGECTVVLNDIKTRVNSKYAILIPAGSKHNIINTGKDDLKLYSVYSPPHHKNNTIHKTKQDALNNEEHFDGKVSF